MRNLNIVQNSPFKVNGSITVALVRESLMLETRGSSTLLSIVKRVGCLKEYGIPLCVFMGRNIAFVQYSLSQVDGTSTAALVRKL
jgi:hypothetical protein